MGESVEFSSNGETAGGYLALPETGGGPGVMVVQEWWGLVPQIKGVCDRLAAEGFVALAPDLFRGEIAEHTEMDKASRLMTELPMDRAARDMGGAVSHLLGMGSCTSSSVGVMGFCMGGMLSFLVAANEGDRVGAIAPYYGAPLDGSVDWSGFTAKVSGHFAETDDFFPPDAVKQLEGELRGRGLTVELQVHPGTGHGFTNEENPLGNYEPELSASCFSETVAFLRGTLS